MSDPFLSAHQVYPHFFNLGGRISPISIRDQMVRGQTIAERAIEAKLIGGEEHRPLLVVGAGAAGATAAIYAASQGVPTVLLDRDASPFTRQAHCATRWIDPTQYDWPVNHWDRSNCPCVPVPTPLPWRADWAHRLAAQWTIRLNHASRTHPWLRTYYRTTVTRAVLLGTPPAGWAVQFNHRAAWFNFGVIAWTVGFGIERSEATSCGGPPDYRGYAFWESDPFPKADCGLTPANAPDVVISGSGDGALQDFLRITTNQKSAEAILRACPLDDSLAAILQSAEDLAQRAFHWGASKTHDHEVVDRLHQVHKGLVESLIPPSVPREPIVKALERVVRKKLPKITLVCSCTHFSNAYGLNRFLTLLVARYMQLYRDRPYVLRFGKHLNCVRGVGTHTCYGNPITCHGEDHEVDLVDAPHCAGKPGTVVSESLSANVLIIRHGIDSSILPPVPDVMLPRQIMPYHV
jgi:hypothetical protein